MRQFIIGDIHGCFAELQELLDKAGLAEDDEIIALGDIVDRGPDSPRVLQFFQSHPQARSLVGNHERKHIRSFHREIAPALSQVISRQQFGAEYPQAIEFMQTFPRAIELSDALLVHGFFEPDVPLEQQRDTVLIGTLSGEKYLSETYARPWYELYRSDKPLVVGHRDFLGTGEPFIYQDRVFGLDTGSYHGGTLTGMLLPNFKIVSVQSRKDYWSEVKREYQANLQHTKSAKQVTISQADFGEFKELANAVQQLHERIWTQLNAEPSFHALPPRAQRKMYATEILHLPLQVQHWLHLARQCKLTTDSFQRSHLESRAVHDWLALLDEFAH